MTTNANIRVLIADDNPRSRSGMRALLTTRPEVEVVDTAQDGEQAVQDAAMLQPDVVLMDVQMPGLDGLEATRQIKARWPRIRVIVLTLYPAYQAAARLAGADAFLLKGSPPEDLFNALTRLMGRNA